MASTWPPARSTTAPDPPLYGTILTSTLAILLKSSMYRRADDPGLTTANFTDPGFCRAISISSATDLACELALTTSMDGPLTINEIGVRSFRVSYFNVLNREGLVA